ncbi:hypothetical protein B0A48_08662 [Cryoendolithus antarcticus]|uniref:Uncharacterized protein n=1 Tax=Cryoendolithus antarcticus TaxID=1507870 RepID=A0A1V8T440_9PEZI|nr:hypothetical protein B0A48_08662 [Cryoendolithus antarcticus]
MVGYTLARPASTALDVNGNTTSLEARQLSNCYARTELGGHGNPHQNYLHKQLSETITCDQENGCTVGQQNSKSFTVGFTFGRDILGWIDGGFGVEESWTTGNSYECNGGPGDTVCIWQKIAHTAYTVRDHDPCSAWYGAPAVITSPNKGNRGGGYYCVVGTCRNTGDQCWDKEGRAGGP